MEPTEDVGVLLVHGIGDHKEGDTLTSFGEPLFDWLREWLLGKSSTADASVLSFQEARLRAIRTEAESPAYAVATIAIPAPNPPRERWIFCEAWWGDSVQPPVALKLLKWLLAAVRCAAAPTCCTTAQEHIARMRAGRRCRRLVPYPRWSS